MKPGKYWDVSWNPVERTSKARTARKRRSNKMLDEMERLYWLGRPVDADFRLVGEAGRKNRKVVW